MDHDRLADKDLLVVSHGYKHFVKSQVDVLAAYFNSVTVCVRYNWFADAASRLPVSGGEGFGKDAKIAQTTSPRTFASSRPRFSISRSTSSANTSSDSNTSGKSRRNWPTTPSRST